MTSFFNTIQTNAHNLFTRFSLPVQQAQSGKGKAIPVAQKTFKLEIAVLSDGGGWSVPRAIQKIETATNTKVKHVDYHAPPGTDNGRLASEIESGLKYIEDSQLHNSKISRAEAFFEALKSGRIQAPTAKAIIEDVIRQAKNLDCIFLPGGENVPTRWYGKAPQRYYEGQIEHYYRSLVELTLIHEARQRGIPLMGVCRGHQIVNVYHGRRLEDVENQSNRTQEYTPLKNGQCGAIAYIFKNTVKGVVYHHQGVTMQEANGKEGELESVTAVDNILKAAEARHGGASPVILTQFHPEFYDPESNYNGLSDNNTLFFKVLHDGANTRHLKRTEITPEALQAGRKRLKPVKAGPKALSPER